MQVPEQDREHVAPGQQKDATVSWDHKRDVPYVSPDPIPVPTGHGTYIIRWQADSSVEAFTISGLDGIDQFERDAADPNRRWLKIKDKATANGSWKYSVWAKPYGGQGQILDPKITNGSR